MKNPKNRLHNVMVLGANPAGISAAAKLGELGIPVTVVDEGPDLNERLADDKYRFESGVTFNYAFRPGLIRILRNPGIQTVMPATVQKIRHSRQGFNVQIEKAQTFVNPDYCTLCGRCVEVCPVIDRNGNKPIKMSSRLSLPGSVTIDKRRELPCQAECPLGVNVQGYIALARAGRYREALALIRRDNVLPGICGRICTHPCEAVCRRADIDDPLAIMDIKRFVYDAIVSEKDAPSEVKKPWRKEHIAVIGSGPAGLACAANMARHGFNVTIFEKEKEAGGLLRYGIGPHRLPREILDEEIEAIKKEGVKIITDCPVDIPADLAGLKENHDAVILATGSWADRRLNVPGEDLKGVQGCLDFLNRFYRDGISRFEERVAVIGDGNAAFDLARTLKRAGAEVTIFSWFAKHDIPADPHEVKGASNDGIIIRDSSQVIEFTGSDGMLQGIRFKPTRPGPKDDKGIAWPEIIPEGRPFEEAYNYAFVAIGQSGAYRGVISGRDLNTTRSGYLITDDKAHAGAKGVYAAGDAVTGATSVVSAMADGRKAAACVMRDLTGSDTPGRRPQRPENRDFEPLDAGIEKTARVEMPEISADLRCDSFREVSLGYDENLMNTEAARCLQCGVCSECLECESACGEIGAIFHAEEALHITENTGVLIIADPDMALDIKGEDVIRAYGPPSAKTNIYTMMQRGFAAAAKAMMLLKETASRPKGHIISSVPLDTGLTGEIRIGVFACRCNDSFGWSEEMNDYLTSLRGRKDIAHVEALASACIPEGINRILECVRDKALTRIVLASCVCCPLDYICSACTDQRSRLKEGLFRGTGISRSMVQTCNLRGEVLRLMNQDESLAVEAFKGLINRSIGRAVRLLPFPAPSRAFNFTTAVLGHTEAAVTSALTLAHLGFEIYMFGTEKNPLESSPEHSNIHGFIGSGATSVSGTLGDFRVRVARDGVERTFSVGCVILGEKSRNIALYHTHRDLPAKTVQSRMQKRGETGVPFMIPGSTSISGLFLADPPGIQMSKNTQGMAAAVLVAAAMPRGPRQYRGFSVTINESLCRSCGRCLQVCPYQAISLKPNNLGGYVAVADAILCKGCGNCISVCPTNAADSPFRDQAYLEQTLEELLLDRRLGS